MITFAVGDILVILAYFAAVLLIGFRAGKGHSAADATHYLLAGRSLTVPLFVMTLVSTWYGGILGVGEFTYRYGIANWVMQGVPFYVFAFVFALLLAERVRKTNLATIPDKLLLAYDRRTSLLGAFLTFLLMTPAPYVLMLGLLLQLVTGWSMLVCITLGTVASAAYLFAGGFRADVHTDVLEFVLMFLGFAVILPFAYMQFGGLEFIRDSVPPLHLTWDGGNSIQFILVWFFIALWTLVDPSFHQRCYAAKSAKVARRGILWSILFWCIFDGLTVTVGLYARAALPDLPQPVLAYPLLAEITLPVIAKGFFYVGLLATMMSTLNTLIFVSATTAGRDIMWRLQSAGDDASQTRYTRWGLLATSLLSIALALIIPSVIKMWYTIGTVIVPGLLVPLVTSYFPKWKVDSRFAFWGMLSGWLTSLGWLLAGWTQQLGVSALYPLGMEPMYPGLIVSCAVWGMGMVQKKTAEDTE